MQAHRLLTDKLEFVNLRGFELDFKLQASAASISFRTVYEAIL